MYKHCSCPYCAGYGEVGFWRCADNKTVILVCDECGAAWLSPAEIAESKPGILFKPLLYFLPGTEISASGQEGAQWASMEEITRAGLAASVRPF